MGPKRANKSDVDRDGGKRAKQDESSSKSADGAKIFSQVSSQLSTEAGSDLYASLNSLLAAAGVQAAQQQALSKTTLPNVSISDYYAALELFNLQQGAGIGHVLPAKQLSTASPVGEHSRLTERSIGLSAAGCGKGVGSRQLLGGIDDSSLVRQSHAALLSRGFGANAVPAQLTAQMVQNAPLARTPTFTSPAFSQYTLQTFGNSTPPLTIPGTGALPTIVPLEAHSSPHLLNPHSNHPLVAVNAVGVDAVQKDPHKVGVGLVSASARTDKTDSGAARSHGPSADRYKNRWSEEEIMALKKGVLKFEKRSKKRTEEGSSSSDRALDSGKKGDTEQMWEYILTSYTFLPCRTARDLKDKWRQLKKKEQDDLLGVREEARRLRMLAVGPGSSSNRGSSQGVSNNKDFDNGSSTGSSSNGSNGHADQADTRNPSEDSPAGSSSPSAGMSGSSGSGSSPAPTTSAAERSENARATVKAAVGDLWTSHSKPSAATGKAPASNQQRNVTSGSNGSAEGSDGSESGDVEGGSEGSEACAGGSEQGESVGESVGSREGGRGSESSVETGRDSITITDETGQTSTGHSSHSAGTSSHEGRSDSSHEGGSNDGRAFDGASDGSSGGWREDEENGNRASEQKERKRKHQSPRQKQPQQEGSSARSRMSRADIIEGLEGRDSTNVSKQDSKYRWALAIDLGTACVRVSLVNKHGATLAGVEGQRAVNIDAGSSTFSAPEYFNLTCQAIDDAMTSLRKWNKSLMTKTETCRHTAAARSHGAVDNGGLCSCGKCKPPITVSVVGISCFALSLVGVADSFKAITPLYTYADGRNQAYAGELKRKLAEDGSLDFVERRTAPLLSCYAPALFARLRHHSDWAAVSGKVKSWSSLSSYVLSRLTNRVQPMTYCEASTTGIFDREELQWHQGLLNILGVNLATLPTLCDVDELYTEGICAEYRKRWPELTKTAWARGIGEAAAFHIGVGCDAGSRRCIFVNMGTSAAVRVCVPCKDVRSGNEAQGGSHEAAKGGKPAEVPPGLWRSYIKRDLMLLSGTLNDGGSIYAWGLEQLAGGLEEMARMQAEASAMEPDSHGLTVLPFFSGGSSASGGVGLNPTSGTITGMTLRTSRADILRAIMESVALRLRLVFAAITAFLPDHDFEVYASGDALFKSPLWQQVLVDALGVCIHFMPGDKQAAGKGAAVLAMRAIGEEAKVQQKPESSIAPKPAGVSAMKMAFERQEALYNRMNRH